MNDTSRGAEATMTAILGRMATYSGKLLLGTKQWKWIIT